MLNVCENKSHRVSLDFLSNHCYLLLDVDRTMRWLLARCQAQSFQVWNGAKTVEPGGPSLSQFGVSARSGPSFWQCPIKHESFQFTEIHGVMPRPPACRFGGRKPVTVIVGKKKKNTPAKASRIEITYSPCVLLSNITCPTDPIDIVCCRACAFSPCSSASNLLNLIVSQRSL
ncbi:hypothetical protein VTO42DRAFT_8769 [Malbranchea cinnamomea]